MSEDGKDKPPKVWLPAGRRIPIVRIEYQQPKIPAKDVLREFDERRKTNPRLELKQFCAELGVNYASIRVAKTRRDKERRKHKKK
jgi:hypothetical protein